jgi:cystathionine beta-lyase
VLESPLVFERGRYAVDFADLEAKLADPKTTLMLLCNPQNPAGIIWNRETLAHIGRLCREHGVVVVADEIHCDLTDPGCAYVPFTSVSDADARNSIACVSPTKTFNIAGVKTAALVVPDADLRARVSNGLDIDELGEPNAFAITAAIAAYDGGAAWLDELRAYIYANKQAVAAFLEREVPQVHLVPSQATYLLWLDCSAVTHDSRDLERFLRQRAGLFISQGRIYGSCGDCFMRMNIACPRSMLDDGLGRLKMGIAAYLSTY